MDVSHSSLFADVISRLPERFRSHDKSFGDDLESSFDLTSLEQYRSQVQSQNPSFFEPVLSPTPRERRKLCLPPPNTQAKRLGRAEVESRLLTHECWSLTKDIQRKHLEQARRDAGLEARLKAAERQNEYRAFRMRLQAKENYIECMRAEARLRKIGRVNAQIDAEREFRRRLRLPIYIPLFLNIEENYFPELTAEVLSVVQHAWDQSQPDGEVIVDGFGAKITRKDLLTLRGLNWLNDEVINFYFNLIVQRSERNSSLPKTYAFATFFYTTLSGPRGYAGVQRWTRRVDLFAYDVVLVPVHMGNHWCLAYVDFGEKLVAYCDSLGGQNLRCLELLKAYLHAEHQDKKKTPFDSEGWRFECAAVPRQMNGSDCGVFTSLFAEFASRRCEFQFDQRVMPYFRKRMVFEISSMSLMI